MSFPTRRLAAPAVGLLAALAAAKLVIHLATNHRYGFHRDEWYYIVAGQRLAWGYVDHPPLVPLLAQGATALFGLSVPGLRISPALASATVVVLTGLIARELGGKRAAQGLAGLLVLGSPLFLVTNSMFQTVTFDQLVWATASFLVARLLRTEEEGLWIALGIVLGVGLLTKHTVVFWGWGLFLALLLTPQQSWLRRAGPWLAAGLALLIAAPHLRWQVQHGWPILEFLRANNAAVREGDSRVALFLEQLLFIGPGAVPLVVAGLVWLVRGAGRPFRLLAWQWLAIVGTLALLGGKPYYGVPAYLPLYAAGAVALEQYAERVARPRLLAAAAVVVVLASLPPALLGMVLPLHSAETMVARRVYETTRDWGEMVGWPEMAQTVAEVYRTLPPDEQNRAVLLTRSYGEAAALELLGPALGLPRAGSGHNSYFHWGPPSETGEVVITVGLPQPFVERFWRNVEPAATIHNALGLPNEAAGLPILIARGPIQPLREVWPLFKHFN